MSPLLVVLALALLAVGLLIGPSLWRAHQRRRIRVRPLPEEWRQIMERAVPLYGRTPEPLRARLNGVVQQFIQEKEFVGCRGLSVTLEMKITVAANACLLIANRSPDVYDGLYAILLYPGAFVVPEEEHDEAGVVTLHESLLSGQTWETQRIILSWEDIQTGIRERGSGYNVILHEFAHYLDAEDGDANGAPWLPSATSYAQWSQVMAREYEALSAAAEREEDTLLDPYGAEDPAEFFAVATEAFFEQSRELKARHAALYGLLAAYFRMDPAGW